MNKLAIYSLIVSFAMSGYLFAQDVTHFPPQDLTPKEPVFLTLKTKDVGNYSFKCFFLGFKKWNISSEIFNFNFTNI